MPNEDARPDVAKCTKDKACPAMEQYCQPSGSHSKGLEWLHAANVKTGKLTLTGVVYKESARANGIMLNHCPWCGERIDWWRPDGSANGGKG